MTCPNVLGVTPSLTALPSAKGRTGRGTRTTASLCWLVTEVQGKGRGLVAAKDFKMGDLIFSETAAISVDHGFGEGLVWGEDPTNLPMSNDPMLMKSFMEQVMGLSEREKKKLGDRDMTLARREKIICLDLFLINHSSAPNAAFKKNMFLVTLVLSPRGGSFINPTVFSPKIRTKV